MNKLTQHGSPDLWCKDHGGTSVFPKPLMKPLLFFATLFAIAHATAAPVTTAEALVPLVYRLRQGISWQSCASTNHSPRRWITATCYPG